MNTYRAMQHKDGGWHFCRVGKNGGGSPVGACVEHETHATQREAELCYHEFILRERTMFHTPEKPRQQFRCSECREWTASYADVNNGQLVHLCWKHLILGILAKHVVVATEIYSSY